LDELDREEFYRLKCVQDKKKEAKEEEDLEIEARNAKLKKMMGDQKVNEDDKNDFFDEKNILEEEDEDVIF
jgi:V-type H+-transporting ATPase subunit D